jgi:hypothetical protein
VVTVTDKMTENLDEYRRLVRLYDEDDGAFYVPDLPLYIEGLCAYLALMEGAAELWWCEEHFCSGEGAHYGCWKSDLWQKGSSDCRMVPAKLFIPGETT